MHLYSLLTSFVTLVVVSAAPGHAECYAGAQVVRVPAGNSAQAATIKDIISRLGFETWASASAAHQFFDIVIPPNHAKQFLTEISRLGVPVAVMHADLQASILKESEPSASNTSSTHARALQADTNWFHRYHHYLDHVSYIDSLAAEFPENANTFTIGNTPEGRTITGINIFGSEGPGTKPAVIFFGTIHARDWIATMVPEYLAYGLLHDRSNISRKYLEEYDFYIIPIVNPDGYAYSWTNQRMWRKNRSGNDLGLCSGRDLDRNFPFKWKDGLGGSSRPCSDIYRGRDAADAPEVTAMANFLTSKGLSNTGARLFINFQSYGNLFMYPYAWTNSEVPPTHNQIQSVAQGYTDAVRAHFGTTIRHGTPGSLLYPMSGTAMDFAFEVAKIPYSFVHVLRDTGRAGFLLPASQILPSGQETYAGVRRLLDLLHTAARK